MKKRKVKIKEGAWVARIAARRLGYNSVAMVIGRTIYLHNTTTAQFFARPSWVLHELKHVEQYERLGLLHFLWKYLLESIRHGYWNNAFEVEARAAEREYALLERFEVPGFRE